MARVNLEDRFFSDRRVRSIAVAMGWREHMSVGVLAYLWHGSQEALSIASSYQEIQSWTLLEAEECEKFIKVCVSLKFLIPVVGKPGLYEIKGNKEQIEKRVTYLDRAKKGGEVNKIRWEKIKAGKEASSIASSYPEDSSIQGNTMQLIPPNPQSGDPEAETSKSKTSPEDLARVWNFLTTSPIPKVDDLDSKQKRYRAAKQRLQSKPNLDYWTDIIQRINASDFCRGLGDRGWKANFEWLVRPDTAALVLEGKYDSKSETPKAPETNSYVKPKGKS